jgi:hypothetical protein
MCPIRLKCAVPLVLFTLSPYAIAAETTAEKELEAAAFAASESQTQEQEEQAVVEKMEQDDSKDQGESGDEKESGGDASSE